MLMWQGGQARQPETSLLLFNYGRSAVSNKFKRVSNLKEIFTHKSKPVRHLNTNDTYTDANQVEHSPNKCKIKFSDANRLSQTRRPSVVKDDRKAQTNFSIFNPRLPNLFARQPEQLHMKSLQFTEGDIEQSAKTCTDKSLELKSGSKFQGNLHIITNGKKFSQDGSHKMVRKEVFHFCNLELDQNFSNTVDVKEVKSNRIRQSVRIRRKKAENSHKGHRKGVSMFEIQGPKAFGMSTSLQYRDQSQKRYNIETVYISESDKKSNKISRKKPMKEREGSHQLNAWDNNSDSSGQYF